MFGDLANLSKSIDDAEVCGSGWRHYGEHTVAGINERLGNCLTR